MSAPKTVAPGDTFFIDLKNTNVGHIWLVLAVYTPDLCADEWALIVAISSWRKGVDEACLLEGHDPEARAYVSHKSHLMYQDIQEVEVASLLALGDPQRRPRLPPNLLSRAQNGAHTSNFTKKRFKSLIPRPPKPKP